MGFTAPPSAIIDEGAQTGDSAGRPLDCSG
jgi:hypothetical protein